MGHALLASEDPLPGFVPRRERGAAGIDVLETPPHLLAPCAFDLGLGLAHAVEELEREDCALLVRKPLGVLEELVGSLTHAKACHGRGPGRGREAGGWRRTGSRGSRVESLMMDGRMADEIQKYRAAETTTSASWACRA